MYSESTRMQDYFWPAAELGERCERAWSAAVTALPVGTRVTGVVVGRQPFGVFIEIEQGPDAIGLVRVTALPVDEPLPARGTVIEGEVLWHEDHNCQVTVVPRAVAPHAAAFQLMPDLGGTHRPLRNPDASGNG